MYICNFEEENHFFSFTFFCLAKCFDETLACEKWSLDIARRAEEVDRQILNFSS